MNLKNIDRLLLFAETNGIVSTLSQLTTAYGFEPDGTNFYYGINPQNVDSFATTGSALNSFSHRPFFNNILASLHASAQDEKTVVLGVEPPEQADPYDFIHSNLELVRQLAEELHQYQQDALSTNKRLNIIIRFASEMNDPNQSQGKDPNGYKRAFLAVRPIFADHAPDILFAFSPAIRADLKETELSQFWPGDEVVDIIAGTWYIGSAQQASLSTAFMRAYFLHRQDKGKPFGLSEVGGCDAADKHNDQVLQAMLHALEALQIQNITFKYVTIFLQNKWGTDATLGFISKAT